MLLDRIDVLKSYGPDKLPRRLLQCLAKEFTLIVLYYFNHSLFELVNYLLNVHNLMLHEFLRKAVNYHYVSLACKLFEYIICKHILAHIEDHKILIHLQHGFRSGRSCETQLVTTFQDLVQMQN